MHYCCLKFKPVEHFCSADDKSTISSLSVESPLFWNYKTCFFMLQASDSEESSPTDDDGEHDSQSPDVRTGKRKLRTPREWKPKRKKRLKKIQHSVQADDPSMLMDNRGKLVKKQDNPNRAYLSPALNLTRMYKLYETEVEDSVKMCLYRDIFVHDFNLSFGPPRADSCATCDKLAAHLSDPDLQDVQRSKLLTQKEMHVREGSSSERVDTVQRWMHRANKNFFIVALWSYAIQRGFTSKIRHRFLVNGHTFLPCDRDFSHIEKMKRTQINEIRTSEDWIRSTESARHEKPFVVLPMKRLEVLGLASFTDEMFCRPQASADKPFVIQCKYTDADLESYNSFNIRKTGRPRILLHFVCKYREPIAVGPAKVKDLEKQMQYIPPSKMQSFWNDFFAEQRKLASNANKINTHGCTDIYGEQETTSSMEIGIMLECNVATLRFCTSCSCSERENWQLRVLPRSIIALEQTPACSPTEVPSIGSRSLIIHRHRWPPLPLRPLHRQCVVDLSLRASFQYIMRLLSGTDKMCYPTAVVCDAQKNARVYLDKG
ncbi:hypothetical protein PR048_014649 [Dryococelus australis]|uniref:DUF7869 domain-containing protein n=1 Tax=Dryococelus australis TaxID=614101 RepID=A0ABQ9HF22_9NEOP|nr:hypothetical protein PR048_014649 [Dryococelus australis]